MECITAMDAGIKWGISGHVVVDLCMLGRIKGATCIEGIWHIPFDNENPTAYKRHDTPKGVTDPNLLAILGVEKRLGNLTDEHCDFFARLAQKFTFKTGEFFSTPQNPSDYFIYITKGLMRAYLIDFNGNEVTFFFSFENMFMYPYTGIILNRRSPLYMQALEDTVAYGITRDEYMARWEIDSDLKKVCQISEEMSFIAERERSIALLTKDAHTRYVDFLQFYKQSAIDVSRIKDKHIASYLGITPESLSRIKKNLQT